MNFFNWFKNMITPQQQPVSKWGFTYKIDGNDAVVDRPILITCFGGNGDGTCSDPQDDGQTASGVNTKNSPICGCSIAMRGQDFLHLSFGEHAALDDAPIHKLPWHTQIELTI